MAVKDKLKRCYFMIQEISDPVFVVWIILSHKATLTVTWIQMQIQIQVEIQEEGLQRVLCAE